MHLSLSDLLVCPRCGPGHGLVLVPDVVADRRVESGILGCPNCRERYPLARGVADLRAPGRQVAPADPHEAASTVAGLPCDDPEGAVRLGALLELTEATGPVALAGPAAGQADRLAKLLDGMEVVALGRSPSGAERAGAVSWVRADGAIPFRDGAFQAVALSGGWSDDVREGLRVLRPGGRLLLDRLPAAGRSAVREPGVMTVLEQGDILVLARGR
jgi:uncharacterized protein YbaR (Trm112 family)